MAKFCWFTLALLALVLLAPRLRHVCVRAATSSIEMDFHAAVELRSPQKPID